ncbi:SPOUT family RNA methylase [Thermococcus sp.]
MKFILKTPNRMEGVAGNYVKELLPDSKVWIAPMGYSGLVLVETKDNDETAEKKLLQIPEAERVIKVLYEVPAKLEEILSTAEKIARHISENETFAVKTKRRGKHDFSSVDINVQLGARIRELTNAEVNLNSPDRIVYVDILGDTAYISLIQGEKWKKYSSDKLNSRELFKKVILVQMPYWGSHKTCRSFGEKIGRAAQAFEVKELIIAPKEKIDAYQLMEFIRGVKTGQNSRYEVQKAYPWDVEKVPVSVWDMYQVVRDKRRKNRLIIVTDPKGQMLSDVQEKLAKDMYYSKEIIVFMGSREGIPRGIFRFADYVIDLTPYITFATEHAIPAALVALWEVYEEWKRHQTLRSSSFFGDPPK